MTMSDDSDNEYKILKRELGEVWVEDCNQSVVTVKVYCDKLIPGKQRNLPKDGTCDLKFNVDCQSFDISLKLKDKKKKTKTKWKYKMRQLPAKIIRERSTWNVKKGYVEVKLQKQDEKCDWTPMVKARGIDQLASDESS